MKIIILFLCIIGIWHGFKFVDGSELSLGTGMMSNLELSKVRHRLRHRYDNNKERSKLNEGLIKINAENSSGAAKNDSRMIANNEEENKKKELSVSFADDLPEMPIYFQGWVKYLHFKEGRNEKEKPKQFYKNDLFEIQKRIEHISSEDQSDEYGSLNIPSELSFYAILYKQSLNIFSSRRDSLLRTVDVLNIDFIKPIPEGDNSIGGIRDFGKFSEGSCIRVLTKVPLGGFVMTVQQIEPQEGQDIKWVFCLQNDKIKDQLMNMLILLKLKKQHSVGVYVEIDKDGKNKELHDNNSLAESINTNNRDKILNKSNDPKDGYWTIIQDWSQCTLKCGGGFQFQQLMCIGPKKGGKKCDGPSIRKSPCNLEKCPTATVAFPEINLINSTNDNNKNQNKNVGNIKTLPPIIRMMSISKRPLRYDKCVIKEGDALMVKVDVNQENFVTLPQIPIRIVMNEKTFTVFQDDVNIHKLILY